MRSDTNYTPSQQKYLDAVKGGAHSDAVTLLGRLDCTNKTLCNDNRLLVEERDALRWQVSAILDKLARLSEMASRLPPCLRSDWQDTNHFEMTSSALDDHFWLIISSIDFRKDSPCETESGQRLGLIMDIAEEVCRLRDDGILISTTPRTAPCEPLQPGNANSSVNAQK